MEDKYLTVVEEHVDRLGEMAKNIQEELQIQDRMVDDLGNRIDAAQEHVGNVNTRMKVSQLIDAFGSLANAPRTACQTLKLRRIVASSKRSLSLRWRRCHFSVRAIEPLVICGSQRSLKEVKVQILA